uniref:Uncharacterized protein n=1 Tax=Ascaris lumbricoides TaxID=6252 RepID=A0A0M3I1P9_ASCLU
MLHQLIYQWIVHVLIIHQKVDSIQILKLLKCYLSYQVILWSH